MNDSLLQGKVLKNKNEFIPFSLAVEVFIWIVVFAGICHLIINPISLNAITKEDAANFIIVFIAGPLHFYGTIISLSSIEKVMREIHIRKDGIEIYRLLRKAKVIHWEDIQKIQPIELSVSRAANHVGYDMRVWKVETSIEPKFGLSKRRFFFYISNGHKFHRELLKLITNKTGIKVGI